MEEHKPNNTLSYYPLLCLVGATLWFKAMNFDVLFIKYVEWVGGWVVCLYNMCIYYMVEKYRMYTHNNNANEDFLMIIVYGFKLTKVPIRKSDFQIFVLASHSHIHMLWWWGCFILSFITRRHVLLIEIKLCTTYFFIIILLSLTKLP
jgi:hypothetical protein